MHHQDAPDAAPDGPDGYQWPVCTNCWHPLPETELARYACSNCQRHTLTHLGTITDLYPLLNTTAALMPGTNRSASTPNPPTGAPGGKLTAPVPLRMDVLNLTGPGGIAARLRAVEDSWRVAFGYPLPVRHDNRHVFPLAHQQPHATRHLLFLRRHLQAACERYDSISDDLVELGRIAAACRGALDPGPRAARVRIGVCPTRLDDQTICSTPLTAITTRQAASCPTCGAYWATYTALRELRAAQAALTAPAA